jgi:Protein of unknown function DUF262
MLALTLEKDVVWPTGKQMEIIDSLYHNFYVPPVIFAVMRDEDGEEVRICVDGKQRLTSIVKFLDGHVCSPLSTALALYETHCLLCYRLRVCDRLSYLSPAVCDGVCQTGIPIRGNSGGTKSHLFTKADEMR